MTDAQRELLDRLPPAIYDGEAHLENDPRLLGEARAQAVSTLVCRDYAVLASNVRVIAAHADLTGMLSGLPFTTLKGYASARWYPDPALRPMGDVDLMAAPDCRTANC